MNANSLQSSSVFHFATRIILGTVPQGASLFLLAFALHTPALANPSSKNPDRLMALHGTIDGSASIAKNVHGVCLQAEKMILDLQQGIERGNRRPKHKVTKVLDMLGTAWKAERDAQHCVLMGEPCGADLTLRVGSLIQPLASAMIASNGNSNELAKERGHCIDRLRRGKKKLFKFIEKSKSGIASGRHLQVQKEMEAKGIDIYRDTRLLSVTLRNQLTDGYFIVLGLCDQKVKEDRIRKYQAIAGEKRQAELAHVVTFKQECQRVIGEIREGKTATLAKQKSGDAAEAFDYLAFQWGAASSHITRAYTIRFAFTKSGRSEAKSALKDLEGDAIPLLTRLINTATEVSTPEEIAVLHPKMLASVTMAARRIHRPTHFMDACQSSLDRMAEKTPGYSDQVRRYVRATTETLRWRKEFSSQRARFLTTNVPTLKGLMGSKPTVINTGRRPLGIVTRPPNTWAPGSSSYPSHLLVRHVARGTLNQQVRVEPLIRPSPSLPICIVPYQDSHYVNVLIPSMTTEALSDLENALLIDPAHPAISLATSDAISSAQVHDYEQVCGAIKVVRVEGAITRFIKLSDGAYALTPIGDLPHFSSDRNPLRDRCYRFDMQPQWVQHQYFTVGGNAK